MTRPSDAMKSTTVDIHCAGFEHCPTVRATIIHVTGSRYVVKISSEELARVKLVRTEHGPGSIPIYMSQTADLTSREKPTFWTRESWLHQAQSAVNAFAEYRKRARS